MIIYPKYYILYFVYGVAIGLCNTGTCLMNNVPVRTQTATYHDYDINEILVWLRVLSCKHDINI